MKSKLLLSLLLGFSIFAKAENNPTNLVVWAKVGTKVAYALAEKPKVTFTETDLVITAKGVEVTYSLENMARLTYEDNTLTAITNLQTDESTFKLDEEYPHLKVVTYSPPYKPEFSDEDNTAIIEAINNANPDLLWIGMTAPKQEKWTYSHWKDLNIHCHVGTIGAVFDFFAGTVERAPIWWQEHGLEWLYRLLKEPKRMWRRYIIGNTLFLWNMTKE